MAPMGVPVLTPADFATLQNTLGPMGVLTQMEAERVAQAEALAQRTQAAGQAAGAAGQAYQEAAAAPSPNVAPNEDLINTLTGGLASVLMGSQAPAQRAQQRTRDTRQALLSARADNLKALHDNWAQKAAFAKSAGDLEEETKARTKMDILSKTLVQLNTDRGRADELSEREKERQNRLALEGMRQRDDSAKEARREAKDSANNLNTLVDNMRQDPDIRLFTDVRDGFERVKVGAGRKNAIGDLSLLYGYIKILDPGSVVREGEYANAANTAGIPENIRRLYNKAIDGSKLTERQRDEFVNTSRQLYQSKQKNKDKAQAYWRRQAKTLGVDPDVLIRDLNTEDAPTQSPAPGATPGDPLGIR